MKKNFFVSGEWNITCDVCSKKIKAGDARHRWDGLLVCAEDFENRHPQDFVKARQDKITVPFTRPLETPTFTVVDYACTIDGLTAIAGLAVPGCAIAGEF